MHDLTTTHTMSSREIAELTDKEHSNVMRDIRTMLDVLKKDALSFEGIYKDAYGRDKPCFNLDRELTMTLVSGYDIPLRHRVVTRLAQLEAQQSASIITLPDFTNPAAAARAWADAIEQKQAIEAQAQQVTQQLALAAPKAQALDRISASDENITLTQAAKLLGIKRDTLTHWLHANGWIYRQNASWVAYDAQIRTGRLVYKEAKYTDEHTGQQVHRPYCHLTQKGLAFLAEKGPLLKQAA